MTQKPILLLDVDGVVNAFRPERPHLVREAGTYWSHYRGEPGIYTLRFDQEIVDMILALGEVYEIHWATMWNDKANADLVPLLGIDPLPVLPCDPLLGTQEAYRRGATPWVVRELWYPKTALIPAYVAGRPFAWVDDDHTEVDREFLAQQPDVPQPFLLVKPDARTGLSWDDVVRLVEWADSLVAVAA